MNILCSKNSLVTGVNTVSRAVSNKSTQPILQGILIQAEKDSLIFTGTDLEIGIRCQVPAQIIEEGSAVLPAKLFGEFVRKLPDTDISLILKDGSINIHYYNSDIMLRTFDSEEYPVLPDLMDTNSFILPAQLLQSMIKQTVFAASTDEGRPIFNGILMQIENQKIHLVGTDSHRLAVKKAELDNNPNLNFNGIIPSKTLSEIYRLLREEDEEVHIQFNKSQVSFQFGNVHFLSRLIDGIFPDYNLVIPKFCETKMLVKTSVFTDSVERASLLSRDSTLGVNIIRLRMTESVLFLEQKSEVGNISEQMEVEIEGKELAISFNSKYLLDVLKVINTEEMIIELSGTNSPGIIRPLDDTNYVYVILPVRTS